jgi:uncharacterized circularly permuted ATP-grasp superfamily protein
MSVSDTDSIHCPASKLFDAYRCSPGVYDELNESAGELRSHWRPLVSSLERMGAEELRTRWEEAAG